MFLATNFIRKAFLKVFEYFNNIFFNLRNLKLGKIVNFWWI